MPSFLVVIMSLSLFFFAGKLLGHMETHGNANPFICPTCGKCFVKSSDMKTHIEMEHPQKEKEEAQATSRTVLEEMEEVKEESS